MPKRPKAPQVDGERPRDGEISAAEMAKRLAITPQAIGAWVKRSGAPVRVAGRRVWCREGAFQRWREEQMVALAVREAMPTDLDAARARKANADAEVSELQLAKERGRMVSIDDSVAALGRALDLVVARLRSLGPRMAPYGAEVEQAAEREAEEIILELHNFDEDVLPLEEEPVEVGD